MTSKLWAMSLAVVIACSGGGRGVRSGPGGEGSVQVAAGSGSNQPVAAPPAPLADADKLPLAGKWRITIRSAEDSDRDGGSQYGHYVRISPTGEIFEWERHEIDGGKNAVWKEEATANGWIRQLDARTFRIKWGPNNPFDYHLRSRDEKSFVLGRYWEIKEDPDRARRPYPRPPRGDRHFEDSWTFEPEPAPGTRL